MLSWAGLSMMLVIPLGSDGGMFNNGSIIYWLGLPLAVSFFFSVKNKILPPALSVQNAGKTLGVTLGIYVLACVAKRQSGAYISTEALCLKNVLLSGTKGRSMFTLPAKEPG